MPIPNWLMPFVFLVPLLFWLLVLYLVWRVIRALERSAAASEAIAAQLARLGEGAVRLASGGGAT